MLFFITGIALFLPIHNFVSTWLCNATPVVTILTWKLHQRLCDTVTVTICDVQLVALTIAEAINSHMPALHFVSRQSFHITLKTCELFLPHTTITLSTLVHHHYNIYGSKTHVLCLVLYFLTTLPCPICLLSYLWRRQREEECYVVTRNVKIALVT